MAYQPFEKHYYNGDIKRYIFLLDSILSRIQIKTERGLVEIPMSTSMGRRNDVNRGQPTNIAPVGILSIGSTIEIDKTQTTSHRNNIQSGTNGSVQRASIPITIPFDYQLKTKKLDEALQVFEQIIGWFTPSLDCRVVDNNGLELYRNVKIKLISHSITDNWEGDGNTALEVNSIYNFELHGHMYRDADGDGTGNNGGIQEIIIQLGQGSMGIPWDHLDPWFEVDKDGIHHQDKD